MFFRALLITAALAFAGLLAEPLAAQTRFVMNETGNESIDKRLRDVSGLRALRNEDAANPATILSTALADYTKLTAALYDEGYFGPVVSIRIDGREAAELSVSDLPSQIGAVRTRVSLGKRFRFGTARISPLPPGTDLPADFSNGARAQSGLVQEALDVAVQAWREAGNAKVQVAGQSLQANHGTGRLNVDIRLDPGPRAVIGKLEQTTPSRVRSGRIRRIADFPTGETYDPDLVEASLNRLRKTGAFASVAANEAEELDAQNRLDFGLVLADAPLRRLGVGAEIENFDEIALSAFWLHRNFLGGAERFRFDIEAANLGGTQSEPDLTLGVRLDVPAFYGPLFDGWFTADAAYLDEPGFISRQVSVAAGIDRQVTEELNVTAGVALRGSEYSDATGNTTFELLSFPMTADWDWRDDRLDPTSGWYLNAELDPFLGLVGEASGTWLRADLRGYWSLGSNEDAPTVAAVRAQVGSVIGPDGARYHPDYQFYSGGAATVRGQPYQSLGAGTLGGAPLGGQSFLGLSTELRYAINDTFGAVAFADLGHVGGTKVPGQSGNWHSGAGLGLRYNTGIGPLRLDIAFPTSGDTGDGMQLYLGIGQAF